MKKMVAIMLVGMMAASGPIGCATARYQVVPMGEKGAAATMTWSAAAAENVANNWGKYLTAIISGFTIWKAGDNSGWWSGGEKDTPPPAPITINYIETGDYSPVTYGDNNDYHPSSGKE